MKKHPLHFLANLAWLTVILATAAIVPAVSRAAAADEDTTAEAVETAETTIVETADAEALDEMAILMEEAETDAPAAASEPIEPDPQPEAEGESTASVAVEAVEAEAAETPGQTESEDKWVVVTEPETVDEPDNAAVPAPPAAPAPPSPPTVNRREFVTIGGNSHLQANETANEMVTIMGSAIVDGHVRSECVTVLGNVTINGRVDGEVVCILGQVTLGPNAEVGGELVAVGGSIQMAPGAVVRGEKVSIPFLGGLALPSFEWLGEFFSEGLLLGRLIPHTQAWAWAAAGLFLLINLIFYAIFRRPIEACAQSLDTKPAMAFVSGILVFLLFGPLLFLLLVSVVGILIVPFLFAGMIVATIGGVIAVYRFTGGQLGLNTMPVVAMLVGNVLFTVLYAVPFIGLAVWMLTCLVGIGAATTALVESMRRETGSGPRPHRRPPPPAPSAVHSPAPVGVGGVGGGTDSSTSMPAAAGFVGGEGVSTVGGEGTAVAEGATPQLPAHYGEAVRVGFWPRLGASALDFLLIGGLTSFLDLQFLFPYLWLVYFIAFWAWRATTVGGIVLNLRIERLDGRPVDFGVAAVRSLGSIFSLMAVGLGFMWAGWDEERQSWHDKIAGTTVVRLPRGQPLL